MVREGDFGLVATVYLSIGEKILLAGVLISLGWGKRSERLKVEKLKPQRMGAP